MELIQIMNTPRITHGHVVRVKPVNVAAGPFATPFMKDAEGGFDAVVYNSLAVDPDTLSAELVITAWSDPQNGSVPTIMGLAHSSLPIWGVQYHPEVGHPLYSTDAQSISSTRGKELLAAFVDMVNRHGGSPPVYPKLDKQLLTACTYRVAASAAPTRAPSPAGGVRAIPEAHYDLVERRFGDLGRRKETAEVYERVVRVNKDRVGEIWLDGKSVRLYKRLY